MSHLVYSTESGKKARPEDPTRPVTFGANVAEGTILVTIDGEMTVIGRVGGGYGVCNFQDYGPNEGFSCNIICQEAVFGLYVEDEDKAKLVLEEYSGSEAYTPEGYGIADCFERYIFREMRIIEFDQPNPSSSH